MQYLQIKTYLKHKLKNIFQLFLKNILGIAHLPSDFNINSSNLSNRIHIEDTGTISIFVKRGHFYFPLLAYELLRENIGNTNTASPLYTKNTLLRNDNTFYDYITHVYGEHLSPLQYFNEILLHETLHFCGSNGARALAEGINEYLTRKLALKHGLLTNGCGYNKEVQVVLELEKIFGEKLLSEISFAKNPEILLKTKNPKLLNLYHSVEQVMYEECFEKYLKYNYPNPLDKAKNYSNIDYTEIMSTINNFKKNIEPSH